MARKRLIALVERLTPHERRFLKTYLQRLKPEFLPYLEALLNKKNIDLRPNEWAYLERWLLRLLLWYRMPLHRHPNIYELQSAVYIWRDKQLFHYAAKDLWKLFTKAQEIQEWVKAYEFARELINIAQFLPSSVELPKNIARFLRYERWKQLFLRLSFYLQKLYHHYGFVFNKQQLTYFQQLLKRLKMPPDTPDVYTLVQYYNICGMLYTFIGDYQGALKAYRSNLALLQSKDFYGIRHQVILNSHINCCNACLHLRDWEGFAKHFQVVMDNIFSQGTPSFVWSALYSILLVALCQHRSYPIFQQMVTLAERWVNKLKLSAHLSYKEELLAALAIAYYCLSKHTKALRYCYWMLENQERRKDLLYIMHLLRIIISYEEKDYRLLTHCLRSVYYLILRQKRKGELETLLLWFFKGPFRKQRLETQDWQKALEQLSHLKANYPHYSFILSFFPLIPWLKAQYHGTKMDAYLPTLPSQLKAVFSEFIERAKHFYG